MPRAFFIVPLAILLASLSCSVEDLWPRQRVEISVGGVPALVEIASTPEEREKGLMFRERLNENEGMLFVFPEEKPLSFWMKNTLIPLDVGFFDAGGFLIEVQRMEPDDGKTVHQSPEPGVYALEMNAGWFERHGLRRYARLKLPDPVRGR